MTFPTLTLRPGKDAPIRGGHPWIFSQAIARAPRVEPGEIVRIEAADHSPLGLGTYHPTMDIAVRLLTTDPSATIDARWFAERFRERDAWKRARLPAQTTGYRVIHAEADGLPGLILDRYGDACVFQLHTAGMDRLRADIVQAIGLVFSPATILERSDVEVRTREGLKDTPVLSHAGDAVEAPFLEDGIRFLADIKEGQKTGFFLDQREARRTVGRLARNRRVLNLFGYTGAFSIHAAKGGAAFVATVDISRRALVQAERHFAMNDLSPSDETKTLFLEADVLELLADPETPGGPYDLIICDPPAFAKSERHLPQAIRAYTTLNQACFERLSPGGILVSSSCSGRVTEDMFRDLLRLAAGRAKKRVRVIEWLTQPADHPELLSFPEGRYLKTAILEVL